MADQTPTPQPTRHWIETAVTHWGIEHALVCDDPNTCTTTYVTPPLVHPGHCDVIDWAVDGVEDLVRWPEGRRDVIGRLEVAVSYSGYQGEGGPALAPVPVGGQPQPDACNCQSADGGGPWHPAGDTPSCPTPITIISSDSVSETWQWTCASCKTEHAGFVSHRAAFEDAARREHRCQPRPDTPTDPEGKERNARVRNEALADAANAIFEALGGYPGPELVTFPQALEAIRAGVRGEPHTTPTHGDCWRPGDSAPRDGRDIEGRWKNPEAPDLVVAWAGAHWEWDGCAVEEPDFWRPLGGGRR